MAYLSALAALSEPTRRAVFERVVKGPRSVGEIAKGLPVSRPAVFSEKGFYEVLYLNEKDEVAEGSRTNIFLRKEDSWFTPHLDSGALPGIYTKHFIEMHPQTSEKNIKINDFRTCDEIILTNTLSGEVNVNKLSISSEEYITFNK